MSDDANWPGWISGGAAAIGVMWAFFKRFFSTVTREEFQAAIDDMRLERREMHEENKETLSRIHQRVDELWERV